MTSNRAIRVAIDPRLAGSAPEVSYVFRTVLTAAGYPWDIRWSGARDEPADITYGDVDAAGATVHIPWCGWELTSAATSEPDAARLEHGVPSLSFRGAALSAPPTRDGLAFRSDVVFAAYWWLTGARERHYRRDRRDNLYLGSDDVVWREGLLARPLVSLLAARLAEHFAAQGVAPVRPAWSAGARGAAFVFSHDVDYPEIVRWIEAPRALLRADVSGALEILRHRSHFWQFGAWTAFERDLGARPTFFFMARRGSLAQYAAGIPDAFYDITSPRFTRLFGELAEAGCEVGLHASFHAYQDANRLADERRRLESVAGVTDVGNRHHYWHLDPDDPNETLRRHELAGLRYDSTLAFECYPGFRRGICHPFRPYHPGERRALGVVQVPPSWMDDHYDRRLVVNGIRDAEGSARALLDVVRAVGGVAVVDYHVRGMNHRFYPRYGSWLARFSKDHVAGAFHFRTMSEVVREYADFERTLRAGSREEPPTRSAVDISTESVSFARLTARDVEQVADLHFRFFGDPGAHGYSVATLGRPFLSGVFYPLNLENPHFCCDVALVRGRVAGFNAYTMARSGVFSYLLRHHLPSLLAAAFAMIIRNPRSIRPMLGNARYIFGERPAFLEGVQGMMLVLGVSPEYRTPAFENSAGGPIAARLIARMEHDMRQADCGAWYATVHPENVAVNRFLERQGATIAGSAHAQGRLMRYYVKQLASASA